MSELTIRMRQIADIAEQLPTGLLDSEAISKMGREAQEVYEAIEARDRIGVLMEAGDVVYYATKAFYSDDIGHRTYRAIVGLIANIIGVQESLLLDICTAKMSLRTRPGNPKDDMEERAAVIRVLDEAGPHAY